MRRVFCLVILFVFVFSGCVHIPDSWTKISYEGFGEIAVPEDDWYLCMEDGNLCVKDLDGSVIMKRIFEGGFTKVEILNNESFSNGSYVEKALVTINGEERTLLLWTTGIDAPLCVFDNSIDYELLRIMAKSFVPDIDQ